MLIHNTVMKPFLDIGKSFTYVDDISCFVMDTGRTVHALCTLSTFKGLSLTYEIFQTLKNQHNMLINHDFS